MCYSAQLRQDYAGFVRAYGATIDIDAFVRLYWERRATDAIRISRSVDTLFADMDGADAETIRGLVVEHDRAQVQATEQLVFAQRQRLADAERTLRTRTTRAATESRRIATAKIAGALAKLDDLRRTRPEARDGRIFPGQYVPLLVAGGDGGRVLRPMHYQCRPAGKPASDDRRYPGTYNARRDNLEGYWRGQFGHGHGVLAIQAFYENVAAHCAEGRELAPGETARSQVLEFRLSPPQAMLAACLWSAWRGADGATLLSFAAITDDPPPEVAAAGHDRCIVPLRTRNLDAWLVPDPRDLAAQYAAGRPRAAVLRAPACGLNPGAQSGAVIHVRRVRITHRRGAAMAPDPDLRSCRHAQPP